MCVPPEITFVIFDVGGQQLALKSLSPSVRDLWENRDRENREFWRENACTGNPDENAVQVSLVVCGGCVTNKSKTANTKTGILGLSKAN